MTGNGGRQVEMRRKAAEASRAREEGKVAGRANTSSHASLLTETSLSKLVLCTTTVKQLLGREPGGSTGAHVERRRRGEVEGMGLGIGMRVVG